MIPRQFTLQFDFNAIHFKGTEVDGIRIWRVETRVEDREVGKGGGIIELQAVGKDHNF